MVTLRLGPGWWGTVLEVDRGLASVEGLLLCPGDETFLRAKGETQKAEQALLAGTSQGQLEGGLQGLCDDQTEVV